MCCGSMWSTVVACSFAHLAVLCVLCHFVPTKYVILQWYACHRVRAGGWRHVSVHTVDMSA